MKIVPVPGIPQTQVVNAVRQIMRNEILPECGEETGTRRSWLPFIRQELAAAVETMFKRSGGALSENNMIERLIAKEVNRLLGGGGRYFDNKKLTTMIEAAIQKEVQRQVTERLKLSVMGTLEVKIDPDYYRDQAQF